MTAPAAAMGVWCDRLGRTDLSLLVLQHEVCFGLQRCRQRLEKGLHYLERGMKCACVRMWGAGAEPEASM